jgi:hypothetical protein
VSDRNDPESCLHRGRVPRSPLAGSDALAPKDQPDLLTPTTADDILLVADDLRRRLRPARCFDAASLAVELGPAKLPADPPRKPAPLRLVACGADLGSFPG